MGCDVEVLVRTPFVSQGQCRYGDVVLRRLWSPRKAGLEALVHTVLGVLYAGFRRPAILHIHAVGPAIVTPLARFLRLKVVVTHHGPDYDREKWGPFARRVLQAGELFGMRHANARIAISQGIADLIRSKYKKDSELIPNGVVVQEQTLESEKVLALGLKPGRYFVQVGRFVPEKRQLDLIEAYRAISPCEWKLALAGAISTDAYSNEVRSAALSAGVVLTGFLKGTALQQLYSHAGAFVLPSSHEGLPIALLEALSYGLPVIASNIPANVEVGLEDSSYFPVGDVGALSNAMRDLIQRPIYENERCLRREFVARQFNWDLIAERTFRLYQSVSGNGCVG